MMYGLHPGIFWKDYIGLEVSNIDLINIFKAIMGLYLAFAIVWILGIFKEKYWFTATISNIFFMGGLATGRFISEMADGMPSHFYLIGGFLEAMLAFLGIYILLKEKSNTRNNKSESY